MHNLMRSHSSIQQSARVAVPFPVGLVLLYTHDTRIHLEGERIAHQRLVADPSFHFDYVRRCIVDLAARRNVANVPASVHVFQCLHQ